MIKAEIDRELNRVKVETDGSAEDLEAELIAIMINFKQEKIFTYTDMREMISAAAKSEKISIKDLIK